MWWWCGDGGKSIPGSKPGSGRRWGGMGVGMVLKLDQLLLYLICKYIGNPSVIGSIWIYPTCIQFSQSNAHRVGVASTNRTDKFWHTGSAEEFDGWGVRSYAWVWRSYLQAVLNECYFWFRQCGDVIIYVIPHYLYSDIIVVWMWYSTGIWIIWSTTVLLHFDTVDFPSRKSGSLQPFWPVVRFLGLPRNCALFATSSAWAVLFSAVPGPAQRARPS